MTQSQVCHNFPDHVNATDPEIDMFPTMCTVKADMSQMAKNLKPERGLTGGMYYTVEYDIILCLGLTELKAQVAWTENVRDRSLII